LTIKCRQLMIRATGIGYGLQSSIFIQQRKESTYIV